jgi:hypothetical protein
MPRRGIRTRKITTYIARPLESASLNNTLKYTYQMIESYMIPRIYA